MAYESIKVDLIPGAENAEVLHFSQFDNKRPFFIELFNGEDEFVPEAGMTLTLECRKRDGNIVIISDPVMNDNVAEFSTTEQLTACYGDNTAEIKIVDENDLVIGSANFIINVEKSPTCGGLVSESEIDNLTQQIEEIAQEVIGDDYYNKAQTDALLANKADIEDLPDMSRYYNKYEVDNLLSNYVLSSYLTTNYYSRSDTRSIFVSKGELQIAMQLEGQASGTIATFETAEPAQRLAALKANFLCSGGNGTPSTPIPLVPYTELNVTNCGVNLWNEEWELSGSTVRNKYPIRVSPNTTYFIACPVTADIDSVSESGQYISYITSKMNGTFTTPADCNYIRFTMRSTYGTTYNNDISINYPSTDTSYHAYNADTITIDLDGTRYGGYVDANNGKLVVTHIGIDLGSLNWIYTSGDHSRFETTTTLSNVKIVAGNIIPNALCSIYKMESMNNVYLHSEDKILGYDNYVWVYDSSAGTDADAFKTAVSGQMLAYELATPIEVDISPEYLNAHTGINNVFHDGNGTTEVKYKDTIQHYIDSRV